MDKILIIDLHNQLHRACIKFGGPPSLPKPKVDSTGEPLIEEIPPEVDDSVIFAFNFFRNLRPQIEKFSPDKCFLILEGHPQFRYDIFPEYKANRIHKQGTEKSKNTSDKFFKTKDLVLPLLKHLPMTLCRAANYEADDVIATLCSNMKEEDLTIISNDSDFIQLLQRGYKSIQIYNPIKKEFMVAPAYPYVAWKAIAGDKSDNIPKLLTPKKVEAAMANPEVFKKFLEVEENKANFNTNRSLIEFRDVPEEEIVMTEGYRNFDVLKEEFKKLQFESILKEGTWEKYCNTFDCIKY